MIYRLNVPVTDYQEIAARRVISVGACRSGRSDVIDIWYETSPDDNTRADITQGLYIYGTGHPTPWDSRCDRADWRFIGTVITPLGLVWHAYAGPKKEDSHG